MRKKYLTKSSFQMAMECPRKLSYSRDKTYINKKIEDPFLEALADGGFQVGHLARLYYGPGEMLGLVDPSEAMEKTRTLLQGDVTLFEPLIAYGPYLIRADILVREGNSLKIIEVKSKSGPRNGYAGFLKKDGTVKEDWKTYIYDIAFQAYVLKMAYPDLEVDPYLMLVDKDAKAPTDGLNQKFKIKRSEKGGVQVITSKDLGPEDLSVKLLKEIGVGELCQQVYNEDYYYQGEEVGFETLLEEFVAIYNGDKEVDPVIKRACRECQFKAKEEDLARGHACGYRECFSLALGWQEEDHKEASVFELWNNRNLKDHLDQGIYKLKDLEEEDLKIKPSKSPGLSRSQRQWVQVQKVKNRDMTAYLDKDGIRREMESWTYPLHFIDFETSSPAIPFKKSRKPYEEIAFQFSHHLVYQDGTVVHRGEYLNAKPGVFPNFDFVRELKAQLEEDQGTIFRYSSHENTYLNKIYEQLMESEDHIPDREDLCSFIIDITKPPSSKAERHRPNTLGKRAMVDLLDLVEKYYYHPLMKGSNSIKKLLPTVLKTSPYLQEKYSKPIYGSEGGIKSLNFRDWTWLVFQDGQPLDPYDILPELSLGEDFALGERINHGGAAMTAYEVLQFEDIDDGLRREIEASLLSYCELDTLAMVMVYEAFREMVY